MVIILIFNSLITYVSEYAQINRIRSTIDLTLIEAENMKTTYASNEVNGVSIISLEPDEHTERFIYDLLELNLIGNGLNSYKIKAAAVDQADFNQGQGVIFSVPVVRVGIEDQQQSVYRKNINAFRMIHPEDLSDN